jgi:hypothetical protein
MESGNTGIVLLEDPGTAPAADFLSNHLQREFIECRRVVDESSLPLPLVSGSSLNVRYSEQALEPYLAPKKQQLQPDVAAVTAKVPLY